MLWIRRIAAKWRVTAFALAVAAVSYWFAPPDFIATVSGELINFFGFVIAAVLPAMALTATAMRGSGMSVRRLMQLQSALEKQMTFWAGLVLFCFAAVVIVVVLKPVTACSSPKGCHYIEFYKYNWFSLNSRLFNGFLGYFVALIFGQLMNILRGLKALLEVNAEAARGEAMQRFDESMTDVREGLDRVRNPEGYGETVKLPGHEEG